MKGSWQLTVDRSVTDVFNFLADIRNEAAWNPRVIEIEKVSDGPIATGTVFRGRYRALGTLVTELMEYDPPRRLSFRSAGERMRLSGTFTLTPVDTGTRLALSADLQPQGWFATVAALMDPIIRWQNAAAARRLKAALDKRRTVVHG